jgi:predicted dehydrogenase
LTRFLQSTTALVTTADSVPTALANVDAVLVADAAAVADDAWERLERFVAAGGGCLALATAETLRVHPMFGARLRDVHPRAEVRVLFNDGGNPLGRRLPDAFYVRGPFRALDVEEASTSVLYADWRFDHRPVLTTRPHGQGIAALTTLLDAEEPTLRRIFYRLLRRLAGAPLEEPTLGIGLLGYAPSVGLLHATGAAETPGLALRTICDLSPVRLAAARERFPDLAFTADAAAMGADPEIDLVIIATPPNTHARLALQMLAAGKHVICEKPLALTVADAESMRALAEKQGLHLSCHQNRRWDSDYRMIKQALADGLVGEPFYLETFVGGYGHPCGFWHSHEMVSGGTTYDWGAHYLDWMLDLLPGTVSGVMATRQNRLWHDVTNADRERIQLRYADGTEAEFVHSDLAYIPKPKWYLVGTEGAIVGQWRQVDTYEVDPIHYYQKHELPASEMGADITVRRGDGRGGVYEQTLPEPPRGAYPFHANLADHLLLGEPLEVPLAHTMRVVAILEAAKRSAENGGRLESVSI